MKNKHFILWVLFTVFGLSSCSVISPTSTPAIDVYTLSQPIGQTTVSPIIKEPTAIILALSPIRSSRGLMSTNIIYKDADYDFNSYAYSHWSDNPSKLLGGYLQQYLVQSQYVSAVILVGSRASADLLLEATLVDFSHHLKADKASSTAVVSIIFHLINPRDKTLLAAKQFIEEVPVEYENAQNAVIAINQASELMASNLQAWLEKNIKQITEDKFN